MNIKYIPSEYRGHIEYDIVLPRVKRIKFIPKHRHEQIMQAFYNINYFRG